MAVERENLKESLREVLYEHLRTNYLYTPMCPWDHASEATHESFDRLTDVVVEHLVASGAVLVRERRPGFAPLRSKPSRGPSPEEQEGMRKIRDAREQRAGGRRW